MAKMRAIDAAVRILEKEGVVCAFGVPGAAINPLYSALNKRGSINHILARHVEGASHMAEGYTRAKAGNIGVCIGTSGPAGTDMITGLYSAIADSIPILCITGQAPRARLYKEDFQAVDIESIAKPVTKWAVTVREPALVPRVFSQAFHIMRSGRPGPVLIDLPVDVQLAEIEFDDETYEPLSVYKPAATRKQIEKALDMLNAAERPLIVAGGGVINADASDLLVAFAEITNVPVVPTLMGWGAIPDAKQAIGQPTSEMRDRFTRVLRGHIAIARAVFPDGTTGAQIDTLARQFLWQAGIDFDHGTGHGVGSYLSVHEGPARISKLGTTALRRGMILSNEPGYYKTDGFGIRIENLELVIAADVAGAERPLNAFETLTLAPIDRRLIDLNMLSGEELSWLNDYHARVRHAVGAHVDAATKVWLDTATAPLSL